MDKIKYQIQSHNKNKYFQNITIVTIFDIDKKENVVRRIFHDSLYLTDTENIRHQNFGK